MKQREKVVLVLMSAYNGARYIEEQINSILHQVGVRTRLYIRDDGSRDDTISVLKRYSEDYPDRVSYITGENVGYGQSFLYLLKTADLSSVDYVALSDQDDVWLAEKLAKAIEKMSVSSADIYGSSLTIVNTNLETIGFYPKTELSVPRSIFENATSGNTMVLSTQAVTDMRRYMELGGYSFVTIHDWYIYALLIATGHTQYIDADSYILYRQHGGNSLGHRKDTLFSVAKQLKKMYRMFMQTSAQAEKQVDVFFELSKNSVDIIPEYRNFLGVYQQARTSYVSRVRLVFKYRLHRKIIVHIGYLILCLLGRFPKKL
jgi:glycosyltransferase involved in cell wall biosynthesis